MYDFTYDGEGEVAWPVYLQDFYEFLDDADDFSDEEASLLLAYTLCESPQCWCWSLPPSSVHSLEQVFYLIESTFHHFDPEPLDKKNVKTTEDPIRIAYGFLGPHLCVVISSSIKSDEIPVSHGQI